MEIEIKNCPPGWSFPRTEFVIYQANYTCCKCHQMLYKPLQTSCGHKYCLPCVEDLLATSPEQQCVAGDGSCDAITQYNVFPDFATLREMMRLKVYCINKGCSQQIVLLQLEKHLDVCEYKTVTCPFSTCTFLGTKDGLDKHMTTGAINHAETMSKQLDAYKNEITALKEENSYMRNLFKKMEERQTQLEERSERERFMLAARVKTQEAEIKQTKETVASFIQNKGSVTVARSGLLVPINQRNDTVFKTIYVWTIHDYLHHKNSERTYLDSEHFNCGGKFGYQFSARVYLNGDGIGKGSHLSLYISLLQGHNDSRLSWPFKWRLSMVLMNQLQGAGHLIEEQFDPAPTSASYNQPNSRNKGTGFPLFAPHSVAESAESLVNNSIIIKIRVDIKAEEELELRTLLANSAGLANSMR